MSKIIRLSIAIAVLALAAFVPVASAFCPELPPDCCRTVFSGGCRLCVQGGC
ncbi:MAG TPA: hypothetical protein VEW48_19805 [Thermoanaerobaculia bacterium]|nr:hypothetical protein [Thermoanaerobaculia bacterium]